MSTLKDIHIVTAVNAVLIAPCLVIAFFSIRRAKANHLVVPWYILSVATLCLIALHATILAFTVIVWSKGPRPLPLPYTLLQDTYYADPQLQSDMFIAVPVLSAVYSLLIVAAYRAAFWEHTKSYAELRVWKTGLAKWSLVALEVVWCLVTLVLIAFEVLLGHTACCKVNDSVMGLFDAAALGTNLGGLILNYVIIVGYIIATVGGFFIRRWARKSDLGVPIADSIFAFVSPALVVQILLLIALTVVLALDVTTLYASVLWQVQQVIILGVFVWVLRTRPLRGNGDNILPQSAMMEAST